MLVLRIAAKQNLFNLLVDFFFCMILKDLTKITNIWLISSRDVFAVFT